MKKNVCSFLCIFALGLSFSSCKTYNTSISDTGVTINGITWATRNVDDPGTFVPTPESLGKLYQWNRKIGWTTEDSTEYVSGWDNSDPTGDTWEKANDPCPSGWRLPSFVELKSLVDSENTWTTQNGMDGRIFGNDNNTIFLPASGYRYNDGWLQNMYPHGYYWSSEHISSNNIVYCLNFGSVYARTDIDYGGSSGFCVRCVADTKINNTDTSNPNVPNVSDGITIRGVTWATRNVDAPGTFAPIPENPGKFYQWNRKIAYPATGTVSGWDYSYITGNTWEKANDPCPTGWRVPSLAELEYLFDSGSTWITKNGVKGCVFGSGANTIFLPVSDYLINGDLSSFDDVEAHGYYWSSNPNNNDRASAMDFSSRYVQFILYAARCYGYCVRCVAK
jgi:uncharacterized protein (TIGR02145 family)